MAHAGRKASHSSPWKGNKFLTAEEGGWTTIAPTAVAFKQEEQLPREMNKEDIEQLIVSFVSAAERSLKAGFKLIEIHAAHGYLLNEFLSPLSNYRTDEYGGSFENRIRLLVEIVEAVRKVMGDDLPLFVRISASDWVAGGWNEDDSVKLAAILKHKEVDLIDCSSGGNSPLQQIPVGPLYQVHFAEKIKKEAEIMTGAAGMITTAEEAEQILNKQQADLIIIAREFLRDPYFPLHAAKKLGVNINWPLQYERAKK